MKGKTYSKSVFSGKDVPFIGISEGHGPLFRGNSVEFSLNLRYKGAIQSRRGGVRTGESFSGRIHIGANNIIRAICEGTNIRAGGLN